jgi:hypothetical protein
VARQPPRGQQIAAIIVMEFEAQNSDAAIANFLGPARRAY